MNGMPDRVLAADQPAPVTVHKRKRLIAVPDRRRSRRQFAAARPRSARRSGNWRHIAWDIGIGAVCRLVADALGATLVQQNYSRLVID